VEVEQCENGALQHLAVGKVLAQPKCKAQQDDQEEEEEEEDFELVRAYSLFILCCQFATATVTP
jgi:hypothetical protein